MRAKYFRTIYYIKIFFRYVQVLVASPPGPAAYGQLHSFTQAPSLTPFAFRRFISVPHVAQAGGRSTPLFITTFLTVGMLPPSLD